MPRQTSETLRDEDPSWLYFMVEKALEVMDRIDGERMRRKARLK